jgi:hypothetical protein
VSSSDSIPQIVAFYPSRSLASQLRTWSDQRGGRHMHVSFERSLAKIRQKVQHADYVVLDATEDPAQATDAFFQILKILGPESTTVYTEIVHDGMEVLVRRQGVNMLLGPMNVAEWDDLFVHKFPRILPLFSSDGVPQNPQPEQNPCEEILVSKKTYSVKSIAG